jgi:hypothetical protein
VRCLPVEILTAATAQDAVREGYYGSAWFAHRADGTVSHIEVRGPDYKGSLAGGHKTLFVFGQAGDGMRRVAIAEGPIDALSLAALEGSRCDTLYVATGGGMGPGTLGALLALLARLATIPDAFIASAADANTAGDRYAGRHAELAGRCLRTLRAAAPAGRPRFQRRPETAEGHVKPGHAWVLLPSGAPRSTRELAGANRLAMCNDKQPNVI